ncbi:MAG: adenylate/guanylate cyclase domain-containing protein [Candidatus Limnocylindria bacterium]
MSQATQSALPAAREAVGRREWEIAWNLFREADKAESLAPADLEQMAEAAWWSGHLDERDDAFERAYTAYLEAGNTLEAAQIALRLAESAFQRLAGPIGAGWMGRAERILEDEPPSIVHGLYAGMKAFRLIMSGQIEVGLRAADETIELARQFGSRDGEALGLNLKGRALLKQGDVAGGMALIDESTVAAMGGELHPWATANVYCSTIDACRDLADWQRAVEWTEEADRQLRSQRIGGYPGICRVHRAEIMRLRGTWPEAEQEARTACAELERFRLMVPAGWGYYEVGEVRLRMGDFAAAEEAFQRAFEFGRDPEPGLALLRLARGDHAAAASSIKRALSATEAPLAVSGDSAKEPLGRGHLLPAQVEIALATGDPETAKAAATELEAIAEQYGSTALRAAAATARGSVLLAEGDASAAVESLERGRQLWQTVGAPYDGALVRARMCEAYRAAGDDTAAIQVLEAARSTFERLGALPDLQRVDAMLERYTAGKAATGERQVKTFMFTDMVSSTDLIEAIGDQAWEELIGWHDATLRSLFARYGGEEVTHAGDGFFVAFDEPRPAVESAVAIQRTLSGHRRKNGFAPWVRIGLHTAEATHSGRTYRGKGVHQAARVGALADRDEILVTGETLQAAGDLQLPISETRSVALKGIKDQVEVVSVKWQEPH